MTTEKKLLGTNPSGGPTNVADVFSAGLHIGNATNTAITNGIDLAGEGGMVWVKSRTLTENHAIFDTERQGANWYLSSDTTAAENQDTGNPMMVSFNSDGYTLGVNNFTNGYDPYVAWTFRKKSGFFDCLTYSGDGTSNRQISHSLGSNPAMIIIKVTNGSDEWYVYHTSLGYTNRLALNSTGATDSLYPPVSASTDTTFTVVEPTGVNTSGSTYVAYLFADNSSEDADDQMIKCGSYTTDGSGNASISLGWEPQWVITKKTDGTSAWNIWDTARGWTNGSNYDYLEANTSAAETGNANYGNPTATGFTSNGVIGANANGIYIAIRAPMMVEPEAATDVFAIDTAGSVSAAAPNFRSTFPVDTALRMDTGGGTNYIASRLTQGKYLVPQTTGVEVSTSVFQFDYSNGWDSRTSTVATRYAYMWKRAKGYMDVVAYSGTGSATTVPHSLGVPPEMMLIKARTSAFEWAAFTPLGETKAMKFPPGEPAYNQPDFYNNTAPTNSVFTVGASSYTNDASSTYVAYLFATLAGVSKVGSYTGNGSSQTISCGFSAGSRYILIKRTDATGDWYFWDSVRGISASGGEASYTTPGSYNWTAPSGVTSVSAVVVGGGGAGGVANAGIGGGGGAGALSYKNNITVIPGNTYSVVVGAAGAVTNATIAGGSGGDSSFINSTTLLATGGSGGGGGQSGTGSGGDGGLPSYGDGGGNGGGGGTSSAGQDPGGGGAGGYSGNGTNGAATGSTNNASGGAGSGGSGSRGGGVGVYGEGVSGAGSSGAGNPGSNGSAGLYGAGGPSWAVGYQGAVRIIWDGSSRSFPSTGTGSADEPSLSLNTTAAQVFSNSVDSNAVGFDITENSTTNINVSSGTYIFYAIA